jgi:hypothetical protein
MSLEDYEALVESYRDVWSRVRELETARDFHYELADLANRMTDVFRAKGLQILEEITAMEKQIKDPIGGEA